MGRARDAFRRAVLGAGIDDVTRIEQQARAVQSTGVRDPRAATQNFAGTSYNALSKPMVPEWDADAALRFAYYSNIFVYRCVQITAQAIASMPFRAGADPSKMGDYDLKARLAELLGPPPLGPAPKLSARRLWAWSIAQYLVTGRLAWELELGGQGFGNTDIVNLWPLTSTKFAAIPSSSGTEWFRAFSYNYGSQQPVPLQPEAVFYAWRPSATDFRQPESVLQAARLEISVAVMQERYDYAFLRNDARPASVVVHERFAKSTERDAFRDQWNGSYGGPDNAGKVVFVEASDADDENPMDVRGSLHIEALGLSQRDAQFIQRYDQKLRAICVAFGTPVSKLGDASDRTFSNAKDENRNWWRDTVYPLAVELQDEVNLQLAPRLDPGKVGWFDTSGVPELQPEPFWLPEALSVAIGTYMSQGEARVEIGLPEELPDDFEKKAPPPTPVIAAPALAPGEPPKPADPAEPAPKGEPPPPPEPDKPAVKPPARLAQVVELRDAIRDGRDLIPPDVAAVEHRQVHAERRSAEARQASDHFDTLEVTWEAEFKRLFAQQRTSTLAKLRGRPGRSVTRGLAESADGIFNVDHWNTVVTDAATTLYRQTAQLAAHRLNGHRVRAVTVNALGGDGDLLDPQQPAVVRMIQARANKLAGQVNDTTYGQIKDELSAGVAAGENIDQLASRIGQVFDATKARTRTIARTESVGGYNAATNTIFDTYGTDVAAGKEWLATLDDRTRDDHADADGQQVAAGDQFTVGGEFCDYPGDPSLSPAESVNCRCTLLILTPEDMGVQPAITRTSRPARAMSLEAAERAVIRMALMQEAG